MLVAPALPSPNPASAPAFQYWGKARPVETGPQFHLLPYHCLDVAAVGYVYLKQSPALRAWLAEQLGGVNEDALCEWFSFWLALHDLGKFSISFQGQRSDLVTSLQGSPSPLGRPNIRHDSLGMHFWCEFLEPKVEAEGWFGDNADVFDGLGYWVRAVTGHHGQPPLAEVTHLIHHFRPQDIAAAQEFAVAARALLLTQRAAQVANAMDPEPFERACKELSWWIAGVAVLADWIGSNADIFQYRDTPATSLHSYWQEALVMAQAALAASGVLPVKRQVGMSFDALFPAIAHPSPLQAWAANVPLDAGPQIHLLEDVTGAGKTEAAVMLAHRLMASGCAEGFFIGLPTMATANAMYGRIASVYDKLFGSEASLVLAHGRKTLVEAFAASVIEPGADENDPQQLDESATQRCLRWLADHNKRALLAPAGVGTVDQALLGVLQSKHQSLRLLGLTRKVLVIDEVHACDAYMQRTLESLLEFHARAGGSAILLSATLTGQMKTALLEAFAKGCRQSAPNLVASAYPLATSWSALRVGQLAEVAAVAEVPIATRPDVRRTLQVRCESNVTTVIEGIKVALDAGQCVAWIRNTVGDALAAHAEFLLHIPADQITLFHARYALGDRLDIEEQVLAHFGPTSTPDLRAGRLLIATQVAEQSLDVDFDLLVSDLAPIDRIIQRAGRLRRHVRDALGQRLTTPGATDQRGQPTLWVLVPPWADEPAANWFKQAFPKVVKVYPHHGQLWRTARALRVGTLTMPDDARRVIEDVFGEDSDLPAGLENNANQAEGQAYGDESQAQRNSVKLRNGYQRSGMEWMADTVAPSRLGEDTIDVLLGRWEGDLLKPWRDDKAPTHAWAYSTVRVAKRLISGVAPQPSGAREAALAAAREALPGGGKWVVLLPLERIGDEFVGTATSVDRQGLAMATQWVYSSGAGLHRLPQVVG
jgi:CRISPR-associated endonuclease/helicase Cas3